MRCIIELVSGRLWPLVEVQFRNFGSVSMTALEKSGHSRFAILTRLVEGPLWAKADVRRPTGTVLRINPRFLQTRPRYQPALTEYVLQSNKQRASYFFVTVNN